MTRQEFTDKQVMLAIQIRLDFIFDLVDDPKAEDITIYDDYVELQGYGKVSYDQLNAVFNRTS